MTKPDYRGARGSTVGDDFHELWALRQALLLLDQDTCLNGITVEGIRAEDASGIPQDTWDGVDCTFYYGGDDIHSAERIFIDQLKYSGANPDQEWTVARLTKSTNKKGDNSVFGRLAKAFVGIKSQQPDLISSGNLTIRLVSNQPIAQNVIDALSGQNTQDLSDLDSIKTACQLRAEEYCLFSEVLDFSECGQESRFALEERVLSTISDWADSDSRSIVNHLKGHIHRAMLPEASGEWITRESVLAWMGLSDPGALFPCPNSITKVDKLIQRKEAKDIVDMLLTGEQRICIHGEGGCGKTTLLQEIETIIPQNSSSVIFDCYGGGRYLDSDAYRHRESDAFTQLINDLACELQTPLLLSRSTGHDFPRVFKNRLERAAEIVATKDQNALLMVIIDAADNSIIAAAKQSPPEKSFVHNFMALGDLPTNVRFIVTTRTGRLDDLSLPRNYRKYQISGFTLDETKAHIHTKWQDVSDDWIEDFQHLSLGNPRVQRYALDYSESNPSKALKSLQPSGKDLDQLFKEQFEFTQKKVGIEQDVSVFCAGLIALPRPIPIADLSIVTDLTESHIRDLCSDLAPGIRLSDEKISFSDEDFEHFVRKEANPQITQIQTKIADHFSSTHYQNPYAATHLADALFFAGRGKEIIDLIQSEIELSAIKDPILRREVHLRRLRTAMKVCRESGNNVDAVTTLMIGAEALKTDSTIQDTLIENPDLAACFARETSSRLILQNPDLIEKHGHLLFHLMAFDARSGDNISVRNFQRQIDAWLQLRNQNFAEQRKKHPQMRPHGWDIDLLDIVGETEATLRTKGGREAVNRLRRWRPKSIAIHVANNLASRLIISGNMELLEDCLQNGIISIPWSLFILVPLALAGKEINIQILDASLAKLLRRGLICLEKMDNIRRNENPTSEYFDAIMTACEVSITSGGDRDLVIQVLRELASPVKRRSDKLYPFQVAHIDIALRAYTLLERISGNKATVDSFLVEPPDPDDQLSEKELKRLRYSNAEKKKELSDSIDSLIDIYDLRAQVLLGIIERENFIAQLQNALSKYGSSQYRISRTPYASDVKSRMALSISKLLFLPGMNLDDLFNCVIGILSADSSILKLTEIRVFNNFALINAFHPKILQKIISRAQVIRSMKISAEDKIDAIINLSRLLLPISFYDAESLFNDAIDVASEINIDAIHEIALFAPLSEGAMICMDQKNKRGVARSLATIVSDAAIRLEGQEHFPWSDVAKALTRLDISFALAATARWEDMDIVSREKFLPHVLETALIHNKLTPFQAASLSYLLDDLNIDVIDQLIDQTAKQNDGRKLNLFVEHMAREELLRFGNGDRKQVLDKLMELPVKHPSYWLESLKQTTAFKQIERPIPKSREKKNVQPYTHDEIDAKRHNELETLLSNFQSRYISFDEILAVVEYISREAESYISVSTILDRIGSDVRINDRTLHLDALININSSNISQDAILQTITNRINDWYDSPSIVRWCQEKLPNIIVDQLAGLCRWLPYGNSNLPFLISKAMMPDQQIQITLLEALERHVDNFNAATVYRLIGIIGKYCTAEENSEIISRYADRLILRIPEDDREFWGLTDIPNQSTIAIARFVYSLMGDIDVRIRWRGAHVLRSLARFGEQEILNALVEQYDRQGEPTFRNPDAPFYWLAARLWLVIAFDRIASESPATLTHHGLWLLELASNKDFPHILICEFAKSAVSMLVKNGFLTLNSEQLNRLNSANTTNIPKKSRKRSRNLGFERFSNHGSENRQFQFDSMDTLPYWYNDALRIFADVNSEEFLDIAESWIVNNWGVKENPWKWSDEPRQYRHKDNSYQLWGHSHGSTPTVERFSTYLEWHAMWCAIGELMQSRALADVDEDDYHYDTFENLVAENGLTMPPLWLADIHGPKPLEEKFWFAPNKEIDNWLDDVSDVDFLSEMGIPISDEVIIVGSSHKTLSRDFQSSIRVMSALVSPKTGSALVRALQTIDESWHYVIPLAGSESEINKAPYKLVGWLIDKEYVSGIDEGDLLRHEIRRVERHPSETTMEVLDLACIHDSHYRWNSIKSGDIVFFYQAWGDMRGDEPEHRSRFDETVCSKGWRLWIDRTALQEFLKTLKMDLIVEIEITRRNRGYDYYSRYDEEERKETRYDRVIILRRDGIIEAAEGCLGRWKAPSP